MKDFALNRYVNPKCTVMEPSIPFQTLVNLVDAEHITNEKVSALDLLLAIIIGTTKLACQLSSPKSFDPKFELLFPKTNGLNNISEPQFRKYRNWFYKSGLSNSTCSVFENSKKTKK